MRRAEETTVEARPGPPWNGVSLCPTLDCAGPVVECGLGLGGTERRWRCAEETAVEAMPVIVLEKKKKARLCVRLPTGSRQILEKQNADTSKRDLNFTLHQAIGISRTVAT